MMRLATICLAAILQGPVWAHDYAAHDRAEMPSNLMAVEQLLKDYRATADESKLRAAARYLDRAHLSAQDDPSRILLLRAWLAQAQHRFGDAGGYVDKLLANRDSLPLWLMRANLHRVQGHLSAASEACNRVTARQVLLGQLCRAQVELSLLPMHGAHRSTLARLEALLAIPGALPEAAALQAWAHGVLADLYAVAGEGEAAVLAARLAASLEPTVQRRAALATLLLDIDHPAQALDVAGVAPRAPALLLIRLRALRALHRLETERSLIDSLDAAFRHDIDAGDFLHAREMAAFYLVIKPNLALAAQLAHENWRRQKEPEDHRLLMRTTASTADAAAGFSL